MGAPYLIPAAYTGMSSFRAHIEDRNPPSSEPGTDYYMPTGTPLAAPARCRVVAVGGSIYPATGRYMVLDDGTRWIRYLHLSRWDRRVGDELEAGEHFALSGASGYGSEFFGEPSRNAAFWRNTGGDHVHVTAFEGRGYPPVFNGRGTVDFHALTGGKAAGNGDDDMSAEAEAKINAIYAGMFGARNITDKATPVSWKNIDGSVQKANYGALPIVIHNQVLIAQQSGRIAAIEAVVEQLAKAGGATLDLDAIAAAAERGAATALSRFDFDGEDDDALQA